ncbi:MAG TPA: peptide-N4-asparagine amidase [Rhizomicrobium sp.]|nr:peptide-N4-asparagine amidase [Rhizomicrobium sp.]
MNIRAALLVSALSACAAHAAFAAPPVKAPYKIGSGNVAVIEPPVSHPDETPCVVSLYRNAQFGSSNVNFVYQPPANCPGPYSTIVLSVDVSLDAGIQYDRSGTIWIGGVPLWFGTTAEPNPNLGPSWHFERDVTDYTSLLAGTNPGFVLIANYTNNQDTSIITSSAKLLFYPVPNGQTAPVVPDVIVPLAADGGGTVALNTGTDTVAIDQELPTNIAQADLDVYLQGQSDDEFWYTCVPNNLAQELDSCGGGALREGEITVDGSPAGVAPVYPWIFTGGIDPYLWAPIPGVQTLDFKPFRVPLTPFAGVLSNGNIAHQIALSVYGADSYFSVCGALLLYLDHGGDQVTGSVTQNTLSGQPSPTLKNTITQNQKGNIAGRLDTESLRDFVISGTVNTSAGSEQYTVTQSGRFTNDQRFKITNSIYEQAIKQRTSTIVKTNLASSSGNITQINRYSYPLDVDYKQSPATGGDIQVVTTISQDFQDDGLFSGSGTRTMSTLEDDIDTTDTLLFSGNGDFLGNEDMSSTANYATTDNAGDCFSRTLTAANNVLTGAKTKKSCSK